MIKVVNFVPSNKSGNSFYLVPLFGLSKMLLSNQLSQKQFGAMSLIADFRLSI